MIYCFLADGFEEIEAVASVDTVLRAGIEVAFVGVGKRVARGAHGIKIEADLTDDELDFSTVDGVMLPGGMPGTLNLGKSESVKHALETAAAGGKLVAAICAAPGVLGQYGLLKGKKAVCYPGFEDKLGCEVGLGRTCVSGNFITAIGPGASIEFGLEIVRYFLGDEKAAEIRKSMQCRS